MPFEEIKENGIYKLDDLAELFGIPLSSMRRLVKSEHLKGVKIGNRWLVRGKNILALFEEDPPPPEVSEEELVLAEQLEVQEPL